MIQQLEKYAQAKALFKELIKEARELLIYELLRDKDIDFTTISSQYVKALESWNKDNEIKLGEAGICISPQVIVRMAVEFEDGTLCDYSPTGYEIHDMFYIDLNCNRLFIELPEETQKHEFKPFDKVLVRKPESQEYSDILYDVWVPAYFQWAKKINDMPNGTYYLASGLIWYNCIPYAGNERIIGTTDNPE